MTGASDTVILASCPFLPMAVLRRLRGAGMHGEKILIAAEGDLSTEGWIVPVWLLVGEEDTQWRNLANDTKDKLESQGVEVTVVVLSGQGHVINIDQARLMDWIDGALGR